MPCLDLAPAEGERVGSGKRAQWRPLVLYRIVYSSKATRPLSSEDLEQILVDARSGNEARDVTGALIHVDGVFLQVLEGERSTLETLIASIDADARHDSMKVFHQAEIPERAFDDWSMAWLTPRVSDMSRWAGLEGAASIDELLDHVHRDARKVPRILVSVVEAIAARSQPG